MGKSIVSLFSPVKLTKRIIVVYKGGDWLNSFNAKLLRRSLSSRLTLLKMTPSYIRTHPLLYSYYPLSILPVPSLPYPCYVLPVCYVLSVLCCAVRLLCVRLVRLVHLIHLVHLVRLIHLTRLVCLARLAYITHSNYLSYLTHSNYSSYSTHSSYSSV